MDHFKSINDGHGHATGDLVLSRVASLLVSAGRRSDFVGRWGGEEFVLALPETDISGAYTVAERLRETIARTVFETSSSGTLFVTASFGVAELAARDSLDALVARADAAMYAAKEAGRNRVASAS